MYSQNHRTRQGRRTALRSHQGKDGFRVLQRNFDLCIPRTTGLAKDAGQPYGVIKVCGFSTLQRHFRFMYSQNHRTRQGLRTTLRSHQGKDGFSTAKKCRFMCSQNHRTRQGRRTALRSHQGIRIQHTAKTFSIYVFPEPQDSPRTPDNPTESSR
jgi:hypothetical protein